MHAFYVNKYDWTEAVVSSGSKHFYDGSDTYSEISKCHEADMLDYGDPRPFVSATADDIIFLRDLSAIIGDHLSATAGCHAAAEALVCYVRYQLLRQGKPAEVIVRTSDPVLGKAYLAILKPFVAFLNKEIGMDEPELTWSLRRADKLRQVLDSVVGCAADSLGEANSADPVSYCLQASTYTQVAIRANDTWFEAGRQSDAIHHDSYRPISPTLYRIISQIGDDVRSCWAEAKQFYNFLSSISQSDSEQACFCFSDATAQQLFDSLCEQVAEDQDDLEDYTDFIAKLRSEAILNAAAHRLRKRQTDARLTTCRDSLRA